MLHRISVLEFAVIPPSMVASSAVLEPTTPLRGTSKGAEIRAKIAANRAMRLRIAEAMR